VVRNLARIFHVALLMVVSSWVWGALVYAAEEAATKGEASVGKGLLALGAGLAIGLGAIGTGIAQSRIGAAGAGVIAEKPELTGLMIVLLAIPETVVILGFVIAAIVLFMF
jgi:V/A-type H+-transporting ATPase subunit K